MIHIYIALFFIEVTQLQLIEVTQRVVTIHDKINIVYQMNCVQKGLIVNLDWNNDVIVSALHYKELNVDTQLQNKNAH